MFSLAIRRLAAASAATVALLALAACVGSRPVIVTVSTLNTRSEPLRAAVRDAERADAPAHPDGMGANVVDTNPDGARHLSEARIDPTIVALIVLERTPDDVEPLARVAAAGIPVVVLAPAPGDRGVLCVCAAAADPPERRVRTAVARIDATLRASWHGGVDRRTAGHEVARRIVPAK